MSAAGSWRHAKWCLWERGQEPMSCDCGLDAYRLSRNRAADQATAQELLDAVKGVLEFERVNSVIAGPYDRLRVAYNAVVKEANRRIKIKIENSQTNEEAFGFEPRW